MAEELQDAVSFLEGATAVYPQITSVLTRVQLLALDMSPTEAFAAQTVNEDFVRLAEAYFQTKHAVYSAELTLRMALLEPRTKGKGLDVDAVHQTITCLKKVISFPPT